MRTSYKQQAVALLKSLETGDTEAFAYINPDKYIQHDLAVGDAFAGDSATRPDCSHGVG